MKRNQLKHSFKELFFEFQLINFSFITWNLETGNDIVHWTPKHHKFSLEKKKTLIHLSI